MFYVLEMDRYLDQLAAAWEDYDGDALGRLISFEDKHVRNPRLQVSLKTLNGMHIVLVHCFKLKISFS